MTDKSDGFFVKGTVEEAYERAERAWASRAQESVEQMTSPDWDGAIEFFASLSEESDRAVPILAFAFIDSEIEQLLRAAVNRSVHGGVDQLFGALGPLGSASTRINMAHALHWLTDETVNDLHLLRRIRNRYAHERMPDGLDDERTAQLLANLEMLPRLLNALYAPTPSSEEETQGDSIDLFITPRIRIVAASALTAWTALAQLYVAPASISSGVPPWVLLDPKSDSAPEGIIQQSKLFRQMIDTVIVSPMQVEAKKAIDRIMRDHADSEEE